MKYEPVIGLEVHIQSKTKSKMFCSCSADYFGDKPNTHVCPVCMGLPGAMPTPNKKAIENCIKLALTLECEINYNTKFDRKNYFYPDLPKGYQISQYDLPIGENGKLKFDIDGDPREIRIMRIHQEEDTGKSVHKGNATYLDYNKSGMPLMEVVTEPDLSSVEEVAMFAKRMREIVRYIGVSTADMEKGQMRFELNISLKPEGTTELPDYKVEVKNIGSISVLEKVVISEIERQSDILDSGETPAQETRGLVDMSGLTVSQRSKESEADYRYFPEPDIPLIVLDKEYVEEIRGSIIELPQEKKERYIKEYGMGADKAETLVGSVVRYTEFEDMLDGIDDELLIKSATNMYLSDYMNLVKTDEEAHSDFRIPQIIEIVKVKDKGEITGNSAKEVLAECYRTGSSPEAIIKEKGFEVISDSGAIEGAINTVLAANEKAVEDFKSGANPNAIMFLLGQVMKEMKGQADAQTVKSKLEEVL